MTLRSGVASGCSGRPLSCVERRAGTGHLDFVEGLVPYFDKSAGSEGAGRRVNYRSCSGRVMWRSGVAS